ncbi:uracil-DNA glycosylase [Mycolicibacillus parakoreensis]|uniref:Type-5 uracil-DNA glycosylase n=1 Tax=Mycolicibacillus parakoreensis TaxID=1069221 RepID=A0ABY3U504_9MYCO|nr:uracil-DNA glycosylase [Mycolicibacillus parakoreensis]MCV7314977.1 uracil-DNA glycosylase [Mycolicibacillus parakoreensis]ULN53655.1 uracil-DNA glycosylase [Mycolicibacillus parakoreensis]
MLPHPRTGRLFDSPVPAGGGWPGDPATAATAVAETVERVVELAAGAESLAELDAAVSVCRACPRLVQWREQVAVEKRRAFAGEPYWGRPVPSWGAARPRILVVGLAPAAHGANRTGRMFTGDRSGDQLYAALHRAGLVNQPTSVDAADGLHTDSVRIIAPVHCAPPGNAPSTVERNTCLPWLHAEWRLIAPHVRVIIPLGGFAWQIAVRLLAEQITAKPKPKFGHGATVTLTSGATLLGCFHPSQQNMFTGRLTPAMLDDIFTRAARLSGTSRPDPAL